MASWYIYEPVWYLQTACILREKLCSNIKCLFKLTWYSLNIISSNICVNKNNISMYFNHGSNTQNIAEKEITKQKKKTKNISCYITPLLWADRGLISISQPTTDLFYCSITFSQLHFFLADQGFPKYTFLANHQWELYLCFYLPKSLQSFFFFFFCSLNVICVFCTNLVLEAALRPTLHKLTLFTVFSDNSWLLSTVLKGGNPSRDPDILYTLSCQF